MDSIASAAIKYGSKRTRQLLFEPLDVKFILRSSLPIRSKDPRSLELKRLVPYYRGTRWLANLGILLFIVPFIIPFTMPFIGFSGVLSLLIIYIIIFVAVNVLGILVEVSVDAILALKHEKGISLSSASRIFFKYSRENPGQAARYMGAKLIVDTLLLSLVMLLYMPALYALVWLLSSIVHWLTIGASNVAGMALLGFLLVAVLALAAGILSAFIAVPAAAFYGYYTEEAIRHM
jgi:hypothetical protein